MNTDVKINNLLTEALEKLELAIKEIVETKDGKEKYKIGTLGRSIGLIMEFQNLIFQRHPELRPHPPAEDLLPDPELNEEQKELASKLTNEQVAEIDNTILKFVSHRWQKVAKIVGATMSELPSRIHGIPDVYYAQRVKIMVENGILESQGNLQRMRYSEIRLKNNQNK